MTANLRLISVHVEELEGGLFSWVLLERSAREVWTELDRSTAPSETYKQAMAEGLVALQSIVDDLDVGPREAEAESDPGEFEESASEKTTTGRQPGQGPSIFGFGPAR